VARPKTRKISDLAVADLFGSYLISRIRAWTVGAVETIGVVGCQPWLPAGHSREHAAVGRHRGMLEHPLHAEHKPARDDSGMDAVGGLPETSAAGAGMITARLRAGRAKAPTWNAVIRALDRAADLAGGRELRRRDEGGCGGHGLLLKRLAGLKKQFSGRAGLSANGALGLPDIPRLTRRGHALLTRKNGHGVREQ